MRERPILFSSDMVKAILADLKTQTRRVVKPQPELKVVYDYGTPGWCWRDNSEHGFLRNWKDAGDFGKALLQYCPYGQVGDRLWVRETWREPICKDSGKLDYLADYINKPALINWRPSIFMPRWASRITLEVTKIGVERVQDISAEDILAEGFYLGAAWPEQSLPMTWNIINGKKYPWSSNPFVWVIEFKRLGDRERFDKVLL